MQEDIERIEIAILQTPVEGRRVKSRRQWSKHEG